MTSPNLEFLVCELLLHLCQLSLFGLQALLQRLHLPHHLLFVLSDCHFQLGQLRMIDGGRANNKKLHYKLIQMNFLFAQQYSMAKMCNKRCVRPVPALLFVGAPPVFPSGHCPCLTPHGFSLPTLSWCHCGTTHTHTIILLNSLSDIYSITL